MDRAGFMPARFVVSTGSHRIAGVVEDLLGGLSGKALAARAALISEAYRANLPSHAVIADEIDAAIYALMRMPATAAAVEAALAALVERLPDFQPQSVLDVGAGPGTASLVIADIWPEAGLTLCDAHAGFLALARRLMAEDAPELHERAHFIEADLTQTGSLLPPADLVIASYALTELGDDDYRKVAERLLAAAQNALVLVEPGRPRDYARLMAFRRSAIDSGAQLVAPCPHEVACPLSGEDWCHFSARLPRSRNHMRLKNASLGYEDEKYSYLVLARPEIMLPASTPRVLAPPDVHKHETRLKLCTPDGEVVLKAFARRGPHFSRIRRAKWGGLCPMDAGKKRE
jgi:ribosomal protein RSM22 (predicted rRNA methylase)